MPRYLIERIFDEMSDEEFSKIGPRSKAIAMDQFPQIRWEHSHVVVDDEGRARTFCIYSSPDAETLRHHAAELGFHFIDRIYEIGGDVSPADFPA